jgi:hypothetical protein
MNEALMTALASALTAVEEALAAAQEGRADEARALLAIMDEQLEQGQGGNAAHSARRKKILRLEAQTRDLLPEPAVVAELEAVVATEAEGVSVVTDVQPVIDGAEPDASVADEEAEPVADAQPAPAPAPIPLPMPTEAPLPAAVADASPDAPEAVPAPSRAPRNVAAPHALPDEAWNRVATGLRRLGVTADDLDVAASAHEFAQGEAAKARDTYALKVAERLALQARLEAAALRGEYAAANAAWDRLFDVVTALRGREGMARRRNLPDADVKAEVYDAARLDSLKIKQWARGMQAA